MRETAYIIMHPSTRRTVPRRYLDKEVAFRDVQAYPGYRVYETRPFVPCERCGGSGNYLHHGVCFRCGGSGREAE